MLNVIDLEKLENKIQQSDGSVICACSQCRTEGKDRAGNHLRVWPGGAFNCIIDNSKEHNMAILQLSGTEGNGITIYIPPPVKIEIPKSWPLDTTKGLVKNHQYWNKRKISSETCDYFNMGLAFKGQMAGRSVIPLYSESRDKIIGFTGRAIHQGMKPKYKHLGEKGAWLFPCDLLTIRKTNIILLLEGPADALALWEAGIKNTLCLFGVNISSKQLAFLIKTDLKKIVIGLNNEGSEIGNKAAIKLKEILIKYFNEDKVIIGLPDSKDFCDLWGEQGQIGLDKYREKWLN